MNDTTKHIKEALDLIRDAADEDDAIYHLTTKSHNASVEEGRQKLEELYEDYRQLLNAAYQTYLKYRSPEMDGYYDKFLTLVGNKLDLNYLRALLEAALENVREED